jgi:hypothetical protein
MDGKQGPDVVPTPIHGAEGTGATECGAGQYGAATDATATHRACCLSARPAPDSAAALIDEIRDLEDRKSAMAARQARLAVAFELQQRREQADAGVPSDQLGAGVAAQIGGVRLFV